MHASGRNSPKPWKGSAPGGAPGLQTRWTAPRVVGGFDSLSLPPCSDSKQWFVQLNALRKVIPMMAAVSHKARRVMKTYTIDPVPRMTLAEMGSIYAVTLGMLWLFIEPLGAFGLIPAVSTLSGVYLYSLLLFVPAMAIPAALRWHRWYKTHDLPFVRLEVRSAADGVTYSLRVAQNMQIADFLRQYTELLLRGPARSNVEATLRRYYPVLQANRSGNLIDIDSNLTLHAAGIKDGEECLVRAQMHPHLNEIMFSRSRN